MKIITILVLPFLLVACACPLGRKSSSNFQKTANNSSANKGAFIPVNENIGTPEQVKAYQLGRYVDSTDPNAMHERHTVYRREQTAHWNLAAAKGTAASRSYYLTADKSQQDKRQRAYYEAAQEQAKAAQQKLSAAEKRVADLEKENSTLKEKTRPSLL